jgi:pimeloyl-ACP methyl ester carboxylesterase
MPKVRESFVEIDGARLELRRLEGSPTLVFLHEGLGSVSAWREFPAKLATACGAGALVYSRAGYGRSSPCTPPRPLDYMQHEGRVVLPALLAACAVDDAILVGHSDGGSIALVAASLDRARRIRALVLEAAHVFCEDLSVASITAAREAYLHGDLRARLARHHDDVDGAFWGWNRAWLDPDFRRWNLEEYLPGVSVPALVLQGADDPYGTPAQVEAIARGVRGPVHKVMLPGCGHAPHREHEAETLKVMAQFIKQVQNGV